MEANLECGATPKADVRRPKGKRGSLFFEKEIVPWLLLLPVVALNVLVMLGPSLGSVYFAFTNWRGLGRAEWVGLANFGQIFKDILLAKALRNNLKWMAMALVFPPMLALLVAALLAEVSRGQRFLRALYFLPLVVSTTVAARAWQNRGNPRSHLGAVASAVHDPDQSVHRPGKRR